jgi:endonuclease-3 related protein
LIRSTGYFRQKAARLQGFSRWYRDTYGANVRRMFRTEPSALRQRLLGLSGIGPETADSILLYAGEQPVFVVDAYTRRILGRHRLIHGRESYEAIQRSVMDRLPENPRLFNEFHALLVAVGKRYCHRRDPRCADCPLGEFPRHLEDGARTHG